MRMLRIMWILFRYRKLLQICETEGRKFVTDEVGMLTLYMHDDHEQVSEGVVTMGRFNELLTMDPGKMVRDLERLKEIHTDYIREMRSAEGEK